MKVRYIYFRNGLDLAPDLGDSFTFKLGEQFVLHWDEAGTLMKAYNAFDITEIDFFNGPPPPEKEPVPSFDPSTIPLYGKEPCPVDASCDPFTVPIYEPKLNEICTCEDNPDPSCPVHRK